jgi:hypothetical protein
MATTLTPEQSLAIKNKIMQSDTALGPKQMETYEDLARKEGIPIWGLTILGGKPYVNATGLDCKLNDLCKKNGWVKAHILTELIHEDRDEDGLYRCGFKATITLFDNKAFKSALKEISEHPLTKELVAELADRFTYKYVSEGWAGHASVKMSTMKTPDFLRMMALTRATNRAKRQATGTGLTSVEEMGTEIAVPNADAGAVIQGEVVEQPPAGTGIRKVWIEWGPQDREAYVTGFYHLFEAELKSKCQAKFEKDKKRWVVPGAFVHEVFELAKLSHVEVVEQASKPQPREPGE